MALDVMAVAWMLAAGGWLDAHVPVVTLGGHHVVVLGLAAAGFGLLAVLAVATRGFVTVGRGPSALVVLGVVASIAATAGVLSAAVLVVGLVLLAHVLLR